MMKLALARGLRCLVVLPAVVVVPAMPDGVNFGVVDIGSKRKLWTTIAVQRLRDIFARIGEPA